MTRRMVVAGWLTEKLFALRNVGAVLYLCSPNSHRINYTYFI
jgi:hypothetical protein